MCSGALSSPSNVSIRAIFRQMHIARSLRKSVWRRPLSKACLCALAAQSEITMKSREMCRFLISQRKSRPYFHRRDLEPLVFRTVDFNIIPRRPDITDKLRIAAPSPRPRRCRTKVQFCSCLAGSCSQSQQVCSAALWNRQYLD